MQILLVHNPKKPRNRLRIRNHVEAAPAEKSFSRQLPFGIHLIDKVTDKVQLCMNARPFCLALQYGKLFLHSIRQHLFILLKSLYLRV